MFKLELDKKYLDDKGNVWRCVTTGHVQIVKRVNFSEYSIRPVIGNCVLGESRVPEYVLVSEFFENKFNKDSDAYAINKYIASLSEGDTVNYLGKEWTVKQIYPGYIYTAIIECNGESVAYNLTLQDSIELPRTIESVLSEIATSIGVKSSDPDYSRKMVEVLSKLITSSNRYGLPPHLINVVDSSRSALDKDVVNAKWGIVLDSNNTPFRVKRDTKLRSLTSQFLEYQHIANKQLDGNQGHYVVSLFLVIVLNFFDKLATVTDNIKIERGMAPTYTRVNVPRVGGNEHSIVASIFKALGDKIKVPVKGRVRYAEYPLLLIDTESNSPEITLYVQVHKCTL
jgi:hypothetical protein